MRKNRIIRVAIILFCLCFVILAGCEEQKTANLGSLELSAEARKQTDTDAFEENTFSADMPAEEADPDIFIGEYRALTLERNGETAYSDAYWGSMQLELYQGGNGMLLLDDTYFPIVWTVEKERFTAWNSGTSLSGTAGPGKIVLENIFGKGVDIVFTTFFENTLSNALEKAAAGMDMAGAWVLDRFKITLYPEEEVLREMDVEETAAYLGIDPEELPVLDLLSDGRALAIAPGGVNTAIWRSENEGVYVYGYSEGYESTLLVGRLQEDGTLLAEVNYADGEQVYVYSGVFRKMETKTESLLETEKLYEPVG